MGFCIHWIFLLAQHSVALCILRRLQTSSPLEISAGELIVFHHVLVAGIGALGSEVVKNLGLLGCKSVFIADPDILEEKNITRSLLFRSGSAGENKVSHALDQLRSLFPQTRWAGMPLEIADIPSEKFSSAEVLFSCVDTDLARMEIAALSTQYKLSVCDGGLGGTSTRLGRVSWFPGADTAACFACLLTNRRRAELFSTWESKVHACWVPEPHSQSVWTSTPTMSSIVAGLQIETALSSIQKKEAFSTHLDLDQASISQTIYHPCSTECPLHIERSDIIFPICTLAECRSCGRQFSPDRRISWVRRWAVCPSCGSNELAVRSSVRDEMIVSTL